ncbi:uncharacterized protein BDZ99DRAFT_287606 [Mytilinidion resinicola]|uniref:DUF7779 domain-containing protein n=1 Tax=Mytilinidion resinicola TaxID=574789 RepID=A0A6A6YRX6_9PEZI|nr:uncharacterized protein BDZ99DRAFT_287606 [Mytilinidion resinicola]KAF2810715.1 hypothetical protein BDZ99DRAFT_287606 [Mytilinidion resinicola]
MLKRILGLVQAISLRKVSQTSGTGSGGPAAEQINDELDDSSGSSGELVEEPEDLGPESDEAVINSVTERSSTELPTLYEFASQAKTLKVPLYILKPAVQNASFFGRDAILSLIDQKLLPSDSLDSQTQKVFALCGLGGVGKTQVAMEYAFSRRDKFDAIFWIDSDQQTQFFEGFSAIASHLGHTETLDQDRVVSRDIALEWLCNPRKRISANSPAPEVNATWLLIFNNVDDGNHIQSFWPQCSLGSVLITSRDPLTKRGREGVDLEPFEPDEAAELLRKLLKLSGTIDNIDASVRLAKRLGGLPLAITQVAALIERWEMTLEEFIKHLESQASIARVAKNKPSDTNDHYKHSIFTVWALDSLTPGAWALLQVIAFLNPDSIREGLLRRDGLKTTVGYPGSDDDFIDARTDLLKVSLIKRNRPTKNDPEQDGELTLHRLVQDVARAQTIDADVPEMLKFILRLLLSSWPTAFLQFDHDSAIWAKCGELLPHILRVQAEIKKHRVFESSINDRKDYARLLLFAGWYLFERIDFESAKPLYLDVLQLCLVEPVEMAEIQADVLFALSALSAQINGKVEKSLSYAQQHYDARLELRDGSELGEARMAMAYGELAHIQMIAGKHDDAIENAKEGINMTWKSPLFLAGNDWPTFAHSHQAFSLAALGQYEKALELVNATLKYWNSHSNETHAFALGITYRCLGYVKRKQGLQDESKDAWLHALEHFKSTVGDKSHYTSQCCRNLGIYHSQNVHISNKLSGVTERIPSTGRS